MSWAATLKRARSFRQSEPSSGEVDFVLTFEKCFSQWNEQLATYHTFLEKPRVQGQPLDDATKNMLVETRAALRFGLCAVSCEDPAERCMIQALIAIQHRWYESLGLVLSQIRGDSKCRLLASQLLSNMVTSNTETAAVISQNVAISPSSEEISQKIKEEMLEAEKGASSSTNWVNMLVASSKAQQRETLGCQVACIHNCLIPLECDDQLQFAEQLSSDSLLISILLRHFVSAKSIQESLKRENIDGITSGAREEWDSATEWIFLLIAQLLQLGLLPCMFCTLSSQSSQESNNMVLPEQIVLLHCAAEHVYAEIDRPKSEGLGPFGDKHVTDKTFRFLLELLSGGLDQPTSNEDENSQSLNQSAALCSLEMLSVLIGSDNSITADMRLYVGTNTDIIQRSSKALGRLMDELTVRTAGLKAREIKLSSLEQKWMTSFVRFLGNLCYQCTHNQDLMRSTLVPPRKQEGANLDRSALHIILSCTSFSTSCFTLREWTIVAIRNMLNNNMANQELVAKLDAQNPIQSAALDQAGVKVKLDKRGKVSLSSFPEEDEGGES